MFEEKVRRIIQEKYIGLVNVVVENLKTLPITDHGGEVPFANVWEAFAHELQHENSALYYQYLNAVESICQHCVQHLTLTELKLLWLISDGNLEWDETVETFPEPNKMREGVTEELLSWVEQEAEEPEFEEEEVRKISETSSTP